MRKWGLLGLLCLSATAFAQDKTLTITIPGLTVRNAVAKIAELTDEQLEVADSANYNTLVLHLTDVPLEEALSRIADVTDGYWTQSGDKRVLRFDTKKENQQRAETRERQLQAIQEQIDKAVEDLEPWSEFKARMESYALSIAAATSLPYNDATQRLRELRNEGVGTRLAVKLSSLLDMNEVLDLPEQSRVMYSNRPTRMQRELPKGSSEAIKQFLVEFAEWKTAVLPTLANSPVVNGYDPRKFISPTTQPPGHVLVEVRRDDWAQGVTIIVYTFDDQGQEIDGAFTGYTFSVPSEKAQYQFVDISLSDDDFAFTEFLRNSFATYMPDGSPVEDTVLKWMDRFADCATDEPLSWLPGRALVKLADAAGDDLIALLPDLALFEFVAFNTPWNKEVSGQELGARITERWQCDMTYQDGCVTVSPRNPSVARSTYIRREPLEDLMKAVKRDKTLTVQEASKYAHAQEGVLSFRGIERWFVSSVIPIGSNYRPSGLMMFSRSALRFLGSLSAEEMRLATSSSGLPLELLQRKSATALDAWLFRKNDTVYGLHHSSRPLPDPDDYRIDRPAWIDRRASSALPTGVPANSTVHIRIEDRPMMFARPPTERMSVSETLEDFARVALFAEGESTLYQSAQLTVFHIELSFGNDVSTDFTLDQVPALRKDWVTLGQLSEQLRTFINEQIEKARKAREEYEKSLAKQNPPPVR